MSHERQARPHVHVHQGLPRKQKKHAHHESWVTSHGGLNAQRRQVNVRTHSPSSRLTSKMYDDDDDHMMC